MTVTQTKLGFTKRIGSRAVWSGFAGVPTLTGHSDHAGALVGSALKLYLPLPVAVEAEYIYNHYGHGAAFHERKLGLSFFHRRTEWQAGYHWMNTLQGQSLNGVFLILRYNF